MSNIAYRRILAIINPVSGLQDPDDTEKMLRERAQEAEVELEVRRTEGDGDALGWAEEAEEQGFDLVLVSGGDGTVVEAITGLIHSNSTIPLAQLPTGTASLIALALGISRNLEKALDLVFDERSKTVHLDVGYLPQQDRYFALIVGSGYDAHIMEDSPRSLKRRLGFIAYVLVGIKELFSLRRTNITLELDGEVKKVQAHTAMVVNIGRIDSANITLGPDIWHHDGTLDVMVVASTGLRDILRLTWRVLRRDFSNYRDLRFYKAHKVRISAETPLPTQIDGDPLGETPLEVEVVPDGVLMLVPESYEPKSGDESGASGDQR